MSTFQTGNIDNFGFAIFESICIFEVAAHCEQAYGSTCAYGFSECPTGYVNQTDVSAPLQQII